MRQPFVAPQAPHRMLCSSHGLCVQVSVLCKERGALLMEVWQAHATMLRTVHVKLQVLRAGILNRTSETEYNIPCTQRLLPMTCLRST